MRNQLEARSLLRLALGVTLLALPAMVAPGTIRTLVSVRDQIDPASPYLSSVAPLLLYAIAPAAILGTFVLFLAPGLFLALAFGDARTVERWLLHAFAISLVLVSASAGLIQAAVGNPLTGSGFGLLVIGLALTGFGIAGIRLARGGDLAAPDPPDGWWRALAWMAGVPLLLLVVLAPKFYWEAFNGDGAHMLEATRALLNRGVPFFPPEAGSIASYPSANSMLVAYALAPWVRWLGPVEAAVRVPFLLFLMALYAALIEISRSDRRGVGEPVPGTLRGLLWGSLVCFTLAMAYSATYDPYLADIALPATQSALWMVFLLGAVDAFFRGERRWLFAFAVLTALTSPGGTLSLAVFFVSVAIVSNRPQWKRLAWLGAVILGTLVFMTVLPAIIGALGMPRPGGEHGPVNLVARMLVVTPWQPERFLYALIPMGFFPVAGFFAWRSLDTASRALALTALTIFGMFYFRAFGALHHYVPAMVLPIAVFFRQFRPGAPGWPRWATLICVSALLLAFLAALPSEGGMHVASREVGGRLAIQDPGYDASNPAYFAVTEALSELLPSDGHKDVPHRLYGGSPLAWSYYAQHRNPADRVNYTVSWDDVGKPVARIFDQQDWTRDRHRRPVNSRGSRLLKVPKDLLFPQPTSSHNYWILDLNPRHLLR